MSGGTVALLAAIAGILGVGITFVSMFVTFGRERGVVRTEIEMMKAELKEMKETDSRRHDKIWARIDEMRRKQDELSEKIAGMQSDIKSLMRGQS